MDVGSRVKESPGNAAPILGLEAVEIERPVAAGKGDNHKDIEDSTFPGRPTY